MNNDTPSTLLKFVLESLNNRILKLTEENNTLKELISKLISAINEDKDGDYFICKENKELLEKIREVIR